ncbi:hypothetical protein TNCT_446371 [Trichonephila clavata]|nr:hypothetical protein TNCT_446371 [Trichonephila clavata]
MALNPTEGRIQGESLGIDKSRGSIAISCSKVSRKVMSSLFSSKNEGTRWSTEGSGPEKDVRSWSSQAASGSGEMSSGSGIG